MQKPPQRPSRPIPPVRSPTPASVPARPTPVGGTPVQPEVERAFALRDVMDHAVKVQQDMATKATRRRSPGRPMLVLGLCVPLLAFSVWSYVARPTIIWGADATFSAGERESHLRLTMFFLAQRLEAARRQTGHYPATLGEIGEAGTSVSYRLLDDSTFHLSSALDGRQLLLNSREPLDQFLGSNARLLRSAGR